MRFAKEKPHRGATVAEVVVVFAIIAFVGLLILASLPRGRENARLVGCQENLHQIGAALALYAQARGELPTVPALGQEPDPHAPSPLGAMLDDLGLSDFTALRGQRKPPARSTNGVQGARRIPSFVCGSDPLALANAFPAPVSYRANTGDLPDGETGPFAPGKLVKLAEVEAADGLGYTAAFSERLVGTGRAESGPRDYRTVAPPADPSCSAAPQPSAAWRGDAGSSWATPGWVSTLYTHAQSPAAASSCIAADGKTALMGSSSGHLNGIQVLLCDGSVHSYTPRVAPGIWRALGNMNDSAKARSEPAPSALIPAAANQSPPSPPP